MTYRATATSTGNSKGLRLDAALYRDVDVIAPGRLLVRARQPTDPEADPVFEAFFAFLDHQMTTQPARITPFSAQDLAGVETLLEGVTADQDEDLGDTFEMP